MLSLFSGCASLVSIIPPPAVTGNQLRCIELQIEQFVKRHKKVPQYASQLPILPDHDCTMVDGWGKEFHWKSNGKTSLRVWSFGQDGMPGGEGVDEDLDLFFTLDPFDKESIAYRKIHDPELGI